MKTHFHWIQAFAGTTVRGEIPDFAEATDGIPPSFRRTPESRMKTLFHWVPAFAGMTAGARIPAFAGTTELCGR